MALNNLRPAPGTKKKKKRIGRGVGSGHGKTSCRGSKGLFSRSGGGLRHGFEGGQMPLIRRIPKRGFTSKGKIIFQVVNIESLKAIKDKEVISPQEMKASGLIRNLRNPVKVLGTGELTKPTTIKAHAFSSSAVSKIKKAGGKTEIIKKTVIARSAEGATKQSRKP